MYIVQQCHDIFDLRFSSNSFKNPCIITPDGDVFILNFLYRKFLRNVCVCRWWKLENWLQIYNSCTDSVFMQVIYCIWKVVLIFPQQVMARWSFPSISKNLMIHVQCPLNHQETKPGEIYKKNLSYCSYKMRKLVTKNL
jgi:hypothetical protein